MSRLFVSVAAAFLLGVVLTTPVTGRDPTPEEEAFARMTTMMDATHAAGMLERRSAMKRILFPTDFSEAAESAEREAARMAGVQGAELVLLHVTSEAPLWGETLYTAKVRAVFESQRRWAADALAVRVAALAAAGVPARAVVKSGVAWEEIVQTAVDEHADMIVIGTHGRTGLERMFLGSVAERVLRQAPCPVLTIRPGSYRQEGAA
jgi:nucleotide-binding universal stress UspA family protein